MNFLHFEPCSPSPFPVLGTEQPHCCHLEVQRVKEKAQKGGRGGWEGAGVRSGWSGAFRAGSELCPWVLALGAVRALPFPGRSQAWQVWLPWQAEVSVLLLLQARLRGREGQLLDPLGKPLQPLWAHPDSLRAP